MPVHTSELCQSYFTKPPKVLYSIDMVMSQSKLIFSVFDSVMSLISIINQPIVTLKSIEIDNCTRVGSPFNYR